MLCTVGAAPAGSTFELRYKTRSEPIAYASTSEQMEAHLRNLLRLKQTPWPGGPKTITVTNPASNDPALSDALACFDPEDKQWIRPTTRNWSPWRDADGYFGLYSSNVFYQHGNAETAQSPRIKITPLLEKDRYKINAAAAAAMDDVHDLPHQSVRRPELARPLPFIGATTADIDNFEDALRGALNVRKGNAFLAIVNHYSLLKKFKLPTVDLLFPR